MRGVILAIDRFEGPYAGTEIQFWSILEEFRRRNIRVCVLLLRPSRFLEERAPGLQTYVLSIGKVASPVSLWKAIMAARWARTNQYEIVHTFLNDTSMLLPFPMKFSGIKVLISRRDEGFWYTRWNLAILKFNRLAVDSVIANSKAVGNAVMDQEGYAASRVRILHNGLEKPGHDVSMAEARDRLGLPGHGVIVTIIANLRPLKRVADAIRALKSDDPVLGGIHLMIAGADRKGETSASHVAELREIVCECGLEGRVRFMGPVLDTAPLIAASDIGLLCSETEGLPNSVIAFMLAGKPCVVSDAGGNPELITDGTEGRVYETGNVVQLRQCLLELAADEGLRTKFGAAGASKAAKHFTITAMVDELLEIYQAAPGQGAHDSGIKRHG